MEITIKCDCGKDLDISNTIEKYGDIELQIEPCPDCKSENYDEGHTEGFAEGKEEGLAENES